MSEKVSRRMECYFGFFGALGSVILVFTAALTTPGYNPLFNTISSLGEGVQKSLFSVAFVLLGVLNMPFLIYLERELINIKESVRKVATGAAMFTSLCIAMVGIIPDETYPEIFIIFHLSSAFTAFLGSVIYINLYSVLMYFGPKSKMYTGHSFKKYLAYLGFSTTIPMIMLFVFMQPWAEWLLYIFIQAWGMLTSATLLKFRFFHIEGLYFKKSQYHDALKKFEDSIDILNKLNLKDHSLIEKIKENIEFLKVEEQKAEQMKEFVEFWKK